MCLPSSPKAKKLLDPDAPIHFLRASRAHWNAA
jgi:hypothetical protein